MSIITLLVVLCIFCLAYWAAKKIMAAFEIPAQIQAVVTVVIVVIACLWILNLFVPLGDVTTLRLR